MPVVQVWSIKSGTCIATYFGEFPSTNIKSSSKGLHLITRRTGRWLNALSDMRLVERFLTKEATFYQAELLWIVFAIEQLRKVGKYRTELEYTRHRTTSSCLPSIAALPRRKNYKTLTLVSGKKLDYRTLTFSLDKNIRLMEAFNTLPSIIKEFIRTYVSFTGKTG